jgi:hypothetical protein
MCGTMHLRFLWIAVQKIFHSVCRIPLHSGKNMNVNFQCNRHGCVAKPLAYNFNVLPRLQEQGCTRMT